jgi:hypothetical protein
MRELSNAQNIFPANFHRQPQKLFRVHLSTEGIHLSLESLTSRVCRGETPNQSIRHHMHQTPLARLKNYF